MNIAVLGVGGLSGKPLFTAYAGGYLIPEEMERLKVAGAVGDVCIMLLRADGTQEDLEINQRSSGSTPADLQRIDRRIRVVSRANKVVPLLAALRAGVVTDLVIDKECAVRLMWLRGQSGWNDMPGSLCSFMLLIPLLATLRNSEVYTKKSCLTYSRIKDLLK